MNLERKPRQWWPWLWLAASLACGACSRQVSVGNVFPPPVTEALPYRVGLQLDPRLREHTHEENLPEGGTWRVALGPAHATLFDQLLRGMFREVVVVREARGGPGLVAVFEPAIEDYQFSTPTQSQTDYYEAWIKYHLRVYSPDGRLVADWPFSGYGRSESYLLAAEQSLDEATRRAMRDAATVVVLNLTRQPAIGALLGRDGAFGGAERAE